MLYCRPTSNNSKDPEVRIVHKWFLAQGRPYLNTKDQTGATADRNRGQVIVLQILYDYKKNGA